jgi:hypothetical protein
MDEVVRIAPAAGDPSMVAYECPKCGYLTRVNQHQRAAVWQFGRAKTARECPSIQSALARRGGRVVGTDRRRGIFAH